MILINKGVENIFDLTLTENVSISTPTFLFRFVSDVTNVEQTIILPDSSSYTERYNRFTLAEGTDLTFDPIGFYHYYIYEQSSTTNLDYKLSGNQLECGKMLIKTSTTTEPTIVFNEPEEFKVYEE